MRNLEKMIVDLLYVEVMFFDMHLNFVNVSLLLLFVFDFVLIPLLLKIQQQFVYHTILFHFLY